MGRRQELIELNQPIDGWHYRFVLTTDSVDYDLALAPSGWDEDEYTIERDMSMFGVFAKYSTSELKFVGTGRDYLKAEYELSGVNADVKFKVYEILASTGAEKLRFIGKIDFSTYKLTELSVDVQVIDDSFTSLIMRRLSSQVNLLGLKTIDGEVTTGATLSDLSLPEIIINQIAKWNIRDASAVFTENHSLQVTVGLKDYLEAKNTEGLFDSFFTEASQDYTDITLDFSIEAVVEEITAGTECTITFLIDLYNGIVFDSSLYNRDFIGIHFPKNISFSDSITFTIPQGLNLKFRCEIDNGIGGAYSIQYSKIDLDLHRVSNQIDARTIKGILYHQAYDKLIENLTGESGRVYSELVGNTSLGYASDGHLGAITTGRYIRDLWGMNDTISTSLADLYKSHGAIYNAGLGIELIAGVEKLVIEQMEHFFTSEVILDISGIVAPETVIVEYAPELSFNRISVGYNSFDYEMIGGVYEYNSVSKFTTPIKPVDKELAIISTIRADMSLVVKLLEEPEASRDVSGESELIILDTIKTDGEYVVRTEEGFEPPENAGNRDTYINLDITPKRNLLRWGSFIRGFADKYSAMSLIWQTSEKNTRLITEELGEDPLEESADVLISDLSDPLWHPERISIDAYISDEDIYSISEKRYGLIKVTDSLYGWILKLTKKNENELCSLVLLRCNTDYVVPVSGYPLRLTWDDIANVPVADASSVTDWNTFFDLPAYGTAFSGVVVDGNSVKLYGGANITLKEALFFSSRLHILTIDDSKSLCIIKLNNYTLSNLSSSVESVLTTALLPAVTETGIGCFKQSRNLENINFDSLTKLGRQCFEQCVKLVSPNFPELTDANEYGSFFACLGLINPTFPKLKYVGYSMFYACSKLITHDFSKVETADVYAFSGTKLTDSDFSSLKSVRNYCFYSVPTLTSSFPNLETAAEQSFSNTGITNGNFPKLTTLTGSYTFSNTKIVDFDAPLLTNINLGCFFVSSLLRTANLPSVLTVANAGFYNVSWDSISIPSCTNLGTTTGIDNVFNNVSGRIITLTIPAALMTCNGGSPDGDIQALQAANTVNIITV